jgi:branched-chain amino acid transport system permease protein
LIGFFTLLAPAAMWNLLAGCAGLVSIGQQAYVGLGAYGLLYFADALGLNLFAAVLVAGLVGALVAVPTTALAFRLRGGYFAIGTWVIAEVYRLVVSNVSQLGGGSGLTLRAAAAYDRTPACSPPTSWPWPWGSAPWPSVTCCCVAASAWR